MKTLALWLFCTSLMATPLRAVEPLARVSIGLSGGRAMVPASLNGSNGLTFMLDTGFSTTMVHPSWPDRLKLNRGRGQLTVLGIAGEEKVPTYEGAIFDIGGAAYSPRRVGALLSDATRRRRRDGILGSGLFRQYVVEIDFPRRQLALYAPSNFLYQGSGEVVPLRFRRGSTTPVLPATLVTPHGTNVTADFELDTGCDSGMCLGHDFIQKHQLLQQDQTRPAGKFGIGGGTETRSGHLPALQLGRINIANPDVDFFLEGSPVDDGLAGHLGAPIFRQHRVILDYGRKQLILERSEKP